ncbi:MAG: NAD(P)-binding domain-containing protein [Rhodobacter sp.]|uniref:NAD(P)-binding domain-containing protein n=1 Tax=Pararhodobacter sp. TaxID=2127056 RepID=UPI002CDBCD82|nr:NAD(P)-binding domain-containing protein [Pararhodobacter sp.]MCC0072939.1 NAD(P)-binding domain-containing protein [Rhodobacter sp.]HPD93660.1 NAD(P)-binding domain-containing protein [Pararhodobacter sp.]
MRLGFVGTGTIASAVVQGLADDGHVITVSERGAAQSAALAARHDCVRVAPNQGVVDASDTLFLGLLPAVAPEVLRALRFRPEQTVISFMADLPLEVLADLVAPARAAAIVLPFPGIARGGSPLLVLGDRAPVDSLFGARNTLFVLRDAAELDAFLCAQAVLSPAAALVGAAGDWLAERGYDGADFLRLLVGSSLIDSPTAPLLRALDTPGGYNQRLRQHLERAGMAQTLRQGLDSLEG